MVTWRSDWNSRIFNSSALDPRTADFVLKLTARIVEEGKLTTMIVTHSMRQALDVSGEERAKMDVSDLLHIFEKVRGETLDDDALLLLS